MTKCGFVAVLGEANAGKSTLVNALAGQKVSIVSAKPHTTRYDIYGIVCQDQSQMIFIDTPGLIDRPRGLLQSYMAKMTTRSVREADVFLVVIDASLPLPESTCQLLERLKDKPLIVALNKTDTLLRDTLLPLADRVRQWTSCIALISAKKSKGLDFISEEINKCLPTGPFLFDKEDLTQISQRFWAAEMTREKVFDMVHQEIPYRVHVITEEWINKAKELTLRQTIVVDKDRYKKWIIGHEGQRIRTIGLRSRTEIGKELGKTVHLFLTVAVDPQWTVSLKKQH